MHLKVLIILHPSVDIHFNITNLKFNIQIYKRGDGLFSKIWQMILKIFNKSKLMGKCWSFEYKQILKSKILEKHKITFENTSVLYL